MEWKAASRLKRITRIHVDKALSLREQFAGIKMQGRQLIWINLSGNIGINTIGIDEASLYYAV